MKTNTRAVMALMGLGLAAVLAGGCGRDTRVNSDPGPGGPSAADSGKPVVRAAENNQQPGSGAAATAPTTGTDSTGRPSDASGGTTGADATSEKSETSGPANTSSSSGSAQTAPRR